MSGARIDALTGAIGLMGGLALLSGAWALFAPAHFFASVAQDTGTFNAHLMRDVGAAYVTAGAALLWAALGPAGRRAPLVWIGGLFLTLHALGHVWEIATGALPASHWLEDLPGVFVPALVVLALAGALDRRERAPAP
jgi:hypothetical protein